MRNELARHVAAPFGWDESDCSFSLAIVHAMTGFDVRVPFRGYDSGPEALRRIREAGHSSVLDIIIASFPEIPPAEAQRGDLAYTSVIDPLMCPAIVSGPVAFSKSLAGVVTVPRGLIIRAFAV